ncbi:MAG TPA: acetyl-CoA carboxylase biotin carboxyl carrier protein [Candidatus Xenobia bacterium]|nr:acetyl-CoA carboxylase biotin carboxyl carrier protein [Candidatus Xenobia bacterium]
MKRKPPTTQKPQRAAADNFIPFEQVQALIDLLEERGLEEFELEREGMRIRIKRRGAPAPPPVFENYLPASPEPARAESEAPAVAGGEGELRGEDLHIVKSPIVGTFYAAPRPDAPPFVKLGDEVAVGQVLCIIEAMKLMNEIEADVAGEIVRVYVENAQPVEYGESLFAIRPSKKK